MDEEVQKQKMLKIMSIIYQKLSVMRYWHF